MSKKQQLSLSAREKELIKLIQDAEVLGFEGTLIKEYRTQLLSVQAELSEIKNYKPQIIKDIHRVSQATKTNEENNGSEFSISFLTSIPNLPAGEKIFIDCGKCKKLFKRQSMEQKICLDCREQMQEILI